MEQLPNKQGGDTKNLAPGLEQPGNAAGHSADIPLSGKGFQPTRPPEEPAHPSESEEPSRPTDDSLIYHHIIEALREGRSIDDTTARCIAYQLHNGNPDSPLYLLATTGALTDGLHQEIASWHNDIATELESWLDALDEYVGSRTDPSPVDGWDQLWPGSPEPTGAQNPIPPHPDGQERSLGPDS